MSRSFAENGFRFSAAEALSGINSCFKSLKFRDRKGSDKIKWEG